MLTVASLTGVMGYGRPQPASASESILAFARSLASANPSGVKAPIPAGPLVINNLSVGNFEYAVRNGETVSSSWTEADYFSSTEDTVSSWIIFNGNVTIDASFTSLAPMRPTKRKLFTVVYVTGNLTMNGVLSMTARGANHSGTGNSGGATTAVNIRLATGSYSQTAPSFVTVTNPQIPASGGAGAPVRSTTGATPGTAGAAGGTGGGGGGNWLTAGGTVGAGSAGTCFSGGAGTGSVNTGGASTSTSNAGANGGAGSAGVQTDVVIGSGGAGNPGGFGYWSGSGNPGNRYTPIDGGAGTGGVLIVIVEGTLSSSAAGATRFTANGVAGGTLGGVSGGGSGGGSINVFYKILGSAPGSTATAGGNGGAGTARRLLLP
jgi:hypothetical protein